MQQLLISLRLPVIVLMGFLFSTSAFSQTTYYVNDNSSVGDVFTTSVGNNVNPGSATAPFASLQHAVTVAAANDIIYVDAGSYTEQVIITKGITIIGAGQSLSLFTPPASTLVPAPGPFTEIGLFETTQGISDVHISHLSINSNSGSQNIIIQSGGSVKNCTLLNGSQGIFFRIEGAVTSALIENNFIQPGAIGINCQGNGLTATIRNNTINLTNPGFSSGVFAGLDFGPLPQLTINNNIISNHVYSGLEVNSYNGNYNNNSITGTNSPAIRSSGGNTANASCNWYGSSLAATVMTKITGGVTYSPWLIDGTDNSPAVGFQTSATCPVTNSFYVNDNNTTGDVFTTAVGNNANPGTFNAPFATLNYAISQVPAGATIFVDAGTYVENVIVNKSISLLGAKYGQNPGNSLDRGNETIIIPAVSNTTFSGMIMKPAADNITIDGFLLDGDNPALTNGTIVNGVDVNVACGIYNDGIASSYLTVKNNIVKNCVTYGIGLFRAFGNTTGPVMPGALFSQNRVDNASRGIVLAYNAYGNITNNYISRCGGSGTWFSQQRVANLNNQPSFISGNTMENCGLGMQSSSLEPAASVVHYVNNDITGLSSNFAGISLLINNTAGVVLSNNKISGPPVGVYINSANSSAPVLVNNNSFSSITTYAIQSVGSFPVNATCNWYGSAVEDDVKLKISSPNVQYIPWLTNGTDNDVATGFQPLPNNCNGYPRKLYVNDNSQTGDVFTTAVGNNTNPGTASFPVATLQEALNRAQAGDTIYIDAGTYTMANLLLDKSVTILGSNYTISPNLPSDKYLVNTGRNAETIISQAAFFVAANNICISGLRFMPTTTAVSVTVNVQNLKVTKNYFDNAGTATALFLQGVGTAPFALKDVEITDNRFEKSDGITGGTGLFISAVANTAIVNNAFLETGANQRRSTGIFSSSTNSIDNCQFTDNYFKNNNFSLRLFSCTNIDVLNNQLDSVGRGIQFFYGFSPTANINITGNTITNTRTTQPILLRRSGVNAGVSNINISGNTINHGVENYVGVAGMIQLEFGTTGVNGQVNVLNNKINIYGDYTTSSVGAHPAIFLAGNHHHTIISGNELNFSAINARTGAGVNLLPEIPTGIYFNTDGGVNSGALPSSAVFTVENNKINGFKNSIAFYDPTATGLTPVVGYGYLTNGTIVNINNNSFTGDSFAINNGAIGQTVNASCNWYGSNIEENINSKISLATVKHIPWLTNGTDNDVATGFQPLPNNCNGYPRKLYVNDNSQTGDVFTTAVGNNANPGTAAAPFATPDYAYSIAQPGDTIYVDAGTYDLGGLTYSFSKSVTLLGANYQISPNDASNKLLPNATRNAESILTNGTMLIASNNISIEGFTWDAGNRTGVELVNTALTNNDFGNFRFVKNIYKITHTNANLVSFLITGKFVASPAMPVTSGFNIEDNRFEKSGSAAGTTFNFNYVKNILVKDNSFVVTGSTFRTQQIANLGNTGIVELFSFSDNIAQNAGVVVNNNRVASSVTSGNKLINTDRALNVIGAMPESSSIEFSNNIIETTIGRGGFVGYNRSGTSLPGATTTFKVENNVFTGVAVPDMPLQLFGSMNFTVGNSVLNPSFIIRGNKIDYSGDFSLIENVFIRPITVRGNIADLTLENNEIILTNTGSSLYPLVVTSLPPNPAITINTDFSATAFMPANPVINILNNKVQGYKQSVVFYDATTTGKDSYQGYGNLPAGAIVNIHNNSFTGDSVSINNGNLGSSVNATCNWYGTAAAQTILTKVSSNSAQVFPYLTDGTDTDAATGFQPTANTCDGSVPLITLNSFTNATCNGAANGTINITASFGKAPFVFTWTKVGDANFISNDEDPTNFAAGTYRLAITDANGTNIYKTSIDGATPETLEVTITEPSVVTAAITNSSTACSNIATVTADGGTPGYTYLWSNGSTSSTISSVPVGTYTITVTDANGCTATASVTLTVAEAFNPSASVTNVTCFGADNGIITVTNANGTAPFMFSKDGGVTFAAGSFPYSFTNLAPGTYNIAVKDANGCTGFVERTVTQPTPLVATIGNVQSTCFGASTGAITMSVSGGVTAYSYNWTKDGGGFSSSQLNISGLAAGNYTLTVTDKNNCTYSIEVLVPTNAEIVVNETINNVTCRGAANGSIAVNASGGSNTNFSYLWNTGATTSTINNLAPGNYNVRITDNGSGCFVNKSFTITQPASVISLATSKTNATGCNSLGTITANGSGGTPPYTYSVNGNTINGNSIGGLYGGDYNITVTDANGCTTSKLVNITDNGSDEYEGNNSRNQAKTILVGPSINARLAVASDAADWFTFTAPGSTTGLYSIKIMHPTATYTVNVYPSGKNTAALVPTSVINNGERHYQLTAGATYFVSITTTTLSYICYNFTVSALEPIEGGANRTESKIAAAPTVEILKAFTYPNPHNGNFTLSIESPEEGVATVELYTVNGQKLSERKANVVKGKGNTVKYSNMNYAILFYKVRIGKHVVTGKIISPN